MNTITRTIPFFRFGYELRVGDTIHGIATAMGNAYFDNSVIVSEQDMENWIAAYAEYIVEPVPVTFQWNGLLGMRVVLAANWNDVGYISAANDYGYEVVWNSNPSDRGTFEYGCDTVLR